MFIILKIKSKCWEKLFQEKLLQLLPLLNMPRVDESLKPTDQPCCDTTSILYTARGCDHRWSHICWILCKADQLFSVVMLIVSQSWNSNHFLPLTKTDPEVRPHYLRGYSSRGALSWNSCNLYIFLLFFLPKNRIMSWISKLSPIFFFLNVVLILLYTSLCETRFKPLYLKRSQSRLNLMVSCVACRAEVQSCIQHVLSKAVWWSASWQLTVN